MPSWAQQPFLHRAGVELSSFRVILSSHNKGDLTAKSFAVLRVNVPEKNLRAEPNSLKMGFSKGICFGLVFIFSFNIDLS